MVLKTPTPQNRPPKKNTTRLRGLLEEAVNFYRHHSAQTPAGRPALEYLRRSAA